jgi:hypothetical protein
MLQTRSEMPRVDPSLLRSLVATHLDAAGAALAPDWRCAAVGGGLGGQGVFRVAGTATVNGDAIPWSLMLKVLRRADANRHPTDLGYWLREREVVESGFAAELPAGLASPRCYAVVDVSASEAHLWFEDLGGHEATRLDVDQWAAVARSFGRWQAPYLGGAPLPAWPWLSVHWLERWCQQNDMTGLERCAGHPLVRRIYTAATARVASRFWRERELFLTAYRTLPRTVAHLDAYWRNLFVRGGEVVAIDWALAGVEPAGADLCGLVWTNIISGEVRAGAYEEFDRAVFEGYGAGLTDAGWRGDVRAVRLGAIVGCCLRAIAPMATFAMRLAEGRADAELADMIEFVGARHTDELVQRLGAGNLFISARVAEARNLINELDLS